MVNSFVEGSDVLRNNLSGLVANAYVVAALFVTVTADPPSLDEHDQSDRGYEVFQIMGYIYIYMMWTATLCFLMALLNATAFYYQTSGYDHFEPYSFLCALLFKRVAEIPARARGNFISGGTFSRRLSPTS